MRCTAPSTRAGLASTASSRCFPPDRTSRSIIVQKCGERRVAVSPTMATRSRSRSGAGRDESASASTRDTISEKVALTIATYRFRLPPK